MQTTRILLGVLVGFSAHAEVLHAPTSAPQKLVYQTVSFPNVNSPGQTAFEFSKPGTVKPSFSQLLGLLRPSMASTGAYVIDKHDCKHFAYALYEELSGKGYAAHFIAVTLRGLSSGHALVAIDTTDQGRVYVDFTPRLKKDGGTTENRSLAWVEPGMNYMRLSLDHVPSGFTNERGYFEERNQQVTLLKKQIDHVSDEIANLRGQIDQIQAELKPYNHQQVAPELYEKIQARDKELHAFVEAHNAKVSEHKNLVERANDRIREVEQFDDFWVVETIKEMPSEQNRAIANDSH